MGEILQGQDPNGLFSKRSSSNILSDPRILEHLRIVAEEAQSSEKDQDEESEMQNTKRELGLKIAAYNKGLQHGAFRLILKEDLSFEGALRFYFEDGREELTKALRISNKTLVSELLPTLAEKFKPDLLNSSVEKKAKLYEVYEEDEICLDPSDAPLEIALNAKKRTRFVLRLDIRKPPSALEKKDDEENFGGETVVNGTALGEQKPTASSPSLSKISLYSTGSDHSSSSSLTGPISARNEGPALDRDIFTMPETPPQFSKIANEKMPSSPRSTNMRNFLSSPRKGFGIFFDGGSSQTDQSARAKQKVAQTKHKRRGSLGRLKIKKKEAEKLHAELSTEKLAPGILKVFGDHVSPGSNYKSVRATELTTADEIVQQALERYALTNEKSSDYILCDVIGYFTKTMDGTNNEKTAKQNAKKWLAEYSRLISDKEKPLVLQQLWKPLAGFSRRFELRRRVETQDSSFFKPRGSVGVMRAASLREANIPSSIQENRRGTRGSNMSTPSSIGDQFPCSSVDEVSSSGRESTIASPLLPPLDAPYLLLLKGGSNQDDILYHRLDEQLTLVGHPVHHRDDQSPDIVLHSPDVLQQHCSLRKEVEISALNSEMEDHNVNFSIYLEPCQGADICINGTSVSLRCKLQPGDLISFGKHYFYLFKDPSQVSDMSMKLTWFNNLKQFHKLQNDRLLLASNSDNLNGTEISEEPDNRLRLSYQQQEEDDLLIMIMNIVDLSSDGYKLSPTYLLLMCIEYSARYHTELQTRQLLIKISNSIQSIASEKTAEMSKTVERTTIPDKALEELLPQLKPVVFWMSNCLEMLPFLQANMSQFIKDPLDLAVRGDDVLVNADEELLMFLEEVVIYTFQQTVYHLTKVLYIALPAILDTNPFQDVDEDSDKKPQEVETVINIFQATYDVVKSFLVHDDIIHQLFAYLFFFTNASLFNTLMERGAGGKFYRWAKGAQIRGNLDLLESWAAQVELHNEANEYLNILSTAADLLATPKVQLLQADWMTIRRDFPALNPAQIQQILSEYQLGPGKTRPRGWFPPPEEVEPALRTADILLSFSDHPPLKLPTEGFVLDMENGPSDETFYSYLDAVKEAVKSGCITPDVNVSRVNGIHKVQQPEPEVRYSSPESPDDLPDLVVSPASPYRGSPTQEFELEPITVSATPQGKEKDSESPAAPEVPPMLHREETPLRQPEIKAKVSDPSTRSEIMPAAKRPLSRLVSGPTGVGIKARSGSSTVGLFQGRDALGSSTGDTAVVSARGPIKEETRGPDALANGETDENQDMAATAGSSYPNDNSKWVDVTPDVKRDLADGLSVLPINGQETNEDVALHAMNPTVETPKEFDEKKALQRAKLLSRLRNESHVDLHEDSAPALTNGFSNRVLLEGMRESDDRQDDVFIVELDKDDDGIGLGLIDGLYTPLRSPGIYVRTLVAGGPAIKDGRLRLGDRILAVNGTSLVGADYQSAMQQIRQSGSHLSFLVAKSDTHVTMKITASSC
ncbi:ras-associating and dilute domain-containing protein-like [Acropora palmata]|uniref:ras-associating and dilute domain-containing protein-like n=1 Tax=Acropora palmata TaxID=6131 RepID=UPI003D9FFF13